MGYAVKGLVRGRVQGVGYREFVRKNAVERGITGSATNLSDGKVQVILNGPRTEVNKVQHLVASGPPSATVSALSWELIDVPEEEEFVIG